MCTVCVLREGESNLYVEGRSTSVLDKGSYVLNSLCNVVGGSKVPCVYRSGYWAVCVVTSAN